MKTWKTLLKGLLIFLLLLLVTLFLLVGTTSGLHLLLNSAVRWVPGLEIHQVTGGWRNLVLKEVRYKTAGISVSAGELHLALQPGCLVHSLLCVNDLSLRDVDVAVDSQQLSTSTTPQNNTPLGELRTPYPVIVRHVGLSRIHLNIDGTDVALGDFSTGLHWQERALTLTPTRIQALSVTLPHSPVAAHQPAGPVPVTDKTATPEPPLGETLKALFAKPLLPEMPDVRLPLDIDIESIVGEQLHLSGPADIEVNRLQLQAKTRDNQLNLTRLDIDSSLGRLSGSGQATLGHQWPLKLTLNSTVDVAPLAGEKVLLALNGALREQLTLALNLAGPVKAQLNAQTELAQAGLPFDLSLTSEQLRWPLTGAVQYQADNLNFHLQGSAYDYATSLYAAVKGAAIPPATISMSGKGDLEQFNLDKLRLALLQGNIDLKAVADWRQAISWRSELLLSGLNTAGQYPDWPAKLDGKITTRGSLYGGSWQLQVPELNLKGYVKQNAVAASGSLSGNSYNQWRIPGLRLALGKNYLTVKGDSGQTLNIDAEVNASNLDNVLPGLGGTAKGMLKARGTLSAPQLLADLSAASLRWQALNIGRVTLAGDVRSGEQIAGKLALRVEQLKQDMRVIKLLSLNVQGDEKQHQLKLMLQGDPVSGQLALQGSFDRVAQRWKGTLSNTRFHTPVGEWRLTRDMTIDYLNTKQTATLGAHCWQNPHARLCVPEPVDAGPAGHARLVLERFDLAMLNVFLGDETRLAGVFSGDTAISWTPDGALPTGQLRLKGQNVRVSQSVQGATLPVAFSTFTFNAGLRDGRAQLEWLMRLVNNGQLDGRIQISELQKQRTLSGNVNLRDLSLALLKPALVSGENIRGMLSSQLRLGGNLQQPQLFGRLDLRNATLAGSFMPIDLTSANLSLLFNGLTSTLNGQIQTSQGALALNGNADWRVPENWHARVAAQGSRIRVSVPPMLRMDVSPDLVFDASPALLNLAGRVDIPWARINVQQVPESATAVSSDEVMLNAHLQPVTPKSSSIPINSSLVIHVGDDVSLDAFGLKAKLNGDLKLVQDKRGLGLNGQINIPSGRFHAYGQDLIVRKGELQFAGLPDQPYINLEAIRNPEATEDNVTAGLRVTGLADEPKAEVFSDPAMSQEAALSYLLRGQGLSSEGDSSALTSALVGLGVAQSGQVMGKIGETFGVSQLALDTTGVGDSQQVQVSGYVLPGLQVKYGVGIFDSLATLTLRYRVMPKLYLEAVSGVDQALDLLYQFEF